MLCGDAKRIMHIHSLSAVLCPLQDACWCSQERGLASGVMRMRTLQAVRFAFQRFIVRYSLCVIDGLAMVFNSQFVYFEVYTWTICKCWS